MDFHGTLPYSALAAPEKAGAGTCRKGGKTEKAAAERQRSRAGEILLRKETLKPRRAWRRARERGGELVSSKQ
jgi:hypothetical protein